MKLLFNAFAVWINFFCISSIQCMSPLSCSIMPLSLPSTKDEWIEKGRQEAQESLANYRNAQREQVRLLSVDLMESERRNIESERQNTELKMAIKRKIEELSNIVEEMEESHPCAKPPIPQLRRLIEELKRVASK